MLFPNFQNQPRCAEHLNDLYLAATICSNIGPRTSSVNRMQDIWGGGRINVTQGILTTVILGYHVWDVPKCFSFVYNITVTITYMYTVTALLAENHIK